MLAVEDKIEQRRFPTQSSSPGVAKPVEKVVKNSYVPKNSPGNSVSDRLQKFRELEQKQQRSHESHDFRSVLKPTSASSEKMDYRSVLKHRSNTDLSKLPPGNSQKNQSPGPELGTDFREVLSRRKKSREEVLKAQTNRKSNSFSGPSGKGDNSSSSVNYRSVLNRKRNSVPKETSPVGNKENSFSAILEKSPVTVRSVKENLTPKSSPTQSRLIDSMSSQTQSRLDDNKSSPTHSRLIDNKSSENQSKLIDSKSKDEDTERNSDNKTKLKSDSPKVETKQETTYQQSNNDRTLHKGKELLSPVPRRRQASPVVQENFTPVSDPPDTRSTPTQHSSTPVLSDVMDEVDIENLLAKRRQRRRQSPAHKDFIPPEHSNSAVSAPVLSLARNVKEESASRIETIKPPEVFRVSEENENKVNTHGDSTEEQEKLNKLRTDGKKPVAEDNEIRLQERIQPESSISHQVETRQEDFRDVLKNRKHRPDNIVRDSPQSERESSEILSDWRSRREGQNQDREKMNGDVKTTNDNIAHDSTKSKEETRKTRPPLSKMNLNLNIKQNENPSHNGSVKTPENYSDDFRSILSRKKRSSNSFSKYDAKDVKVPSSPKTTDFRHVLTRHVSYVENRHRQAPKFDSTLTDVSVKEGESVTMECHVTGLPRPEILWTMNNNQIKVSVRLLVLFLSYGLVFLGIANVNLESHE